jgi:hypothetical protein
MSEDQTNFKQHASKCGEYKVTLQTGSLGAAPIAPDVHPFIGFRVELFGFHQMEPSSLRKRSFMAGQPVALADLAGDFVPTSNED